MEDSDIPQPLFLAWVSAFPQNTIFSLSGDIYQDGHVYAYIDGRYYEFPERP